MLYVHLSEAEINDYRRTDSSQTSLDTSFFALLPRYELYVYEERLERVFMNLLQKKLI